MTQYNQSNQRKTYPSVTLSTANRTLNGLELQAPVLTTATTEQSILKDKSDKINREFKQTCTLQVPQCTKHITIIH
jgi:hypothetical protein